MTLALTIGDQWQAHEPHDPCVNSCRLMGVGRLVSSAGWGQYEHVSIKGDALRLLVRVGLAGLLFAAGFALVYSVTVRTVQGRLFGDATLRGAMLTSSAMAHSVEAILNVVSVASLVAAIALVTMVALVRLERSQGLAAVGILVGANFSTLVLKRYLLERPDFGINEVSPATLNSLPSGHTTAVFSAFVALVFVVPARLRYPVSVAALAAAIVTALATMSAGWHRAGDSMAAFLLVGVWATIAAGAVVLADAPHTSDRAKFEWPASTRWVATVAGGTIALGLVLGTALNAVDQIRDATFGSWVAFLVGVLLITGTAIGVLLGVLHVLDLRDTPRSSGSRTPPQPPWDDSPQG